MSHLSRGVCRLVLAAALAFTVVAGLGAQEVQFVFTSDPHYGITRKAFQGAANVDAHTVNAALVGKINSISALTFDTDGGLSAGKAVGPVDFVVVGGDIANRQEGTQEKAIQSASASWAQFKTDYIDGLALKGRGGSPAPLSVITGNHDVTNAIGFYKPMYPATDGTALAEIYNIAMKPAVKKTKDTITYAKDRVHYSFDMAGVHFVFLNMWPDSAERRWLGTDLSSVASTTPVVLFSHDEPETEAKHFTNPNGAFDINAKDKFENLLADKLADGPTVSAPTTLEQRSLEAFLSLHPNVSVYFHGNDHWKRFSDWTGPDNSVLLHVFGVDSPMKGTVSSTDETKLSFYVVTIDSARRLMTVRDCLWNADPSKPASPVVWGEAITVAMYPRPVK